MEFLSILEKIKDQIDQKIYSDFARREKIVGHIILGSGIVLSVIALISSSFQLLSNPNYDLSSFGHIITGLLVMIIFISTFFCVGIVGSYFIITIIRWIFNFKEEYNHFIFTRNCRQESLRWQAVSEGRCYNCGIKSLYTRKDGSKRCSKCGWDSRHDD